MEHVHYRCRVSSKDISEMYTIRNYPNYKGLIMTWKPSWVLARPWRASYDELRQDIPRHVDRPYRVGYCVLLLMMTCQSVYDRVSVYSFFTTGQHQHRLADAHFLMLCLNDLIAKRGKLSMYIFIIKAEDT